MKLKKYQVDILFLLSGFIIIFFSAIRSLTVGTDTSSYYEWYQTLFNNDSTLSNLILINLNDNEPAFVFINFIFVFFNFNYFIALSVYSTIFWTISYFSFKNERKYIYLTIFFFITTGILFFTFNAVRQSLALCLVFYSVKFIFNKKFLPFSFLILLASLFHFSAILLIPIYFVNRLNQVTRNTWIVAFVVSLFFPISLLFKPIYWLIDFFPSYGGYLISSRFTEAKLISLGVVYQILLGFLAIFYYPIVATDKKIKLYFHLFFIGEIAYHLFYGSFFILRFVVYLLFFQPFVYTYIFKHLLLQKKFLDIFLITFYFLIMFLYKILMSDSGCSPYSFF